MLESCCSGGFYITTVEYITRFLDHGCFVREVTLPPDTNIVKDADGDKWRVAKMIQIYNLSDVKTFELLISLDIYECSTDIFRWAINNNYYEIFK